MLCSDWLVLFSVIKSHLWGKKTTLNSPQRNGNYFPFSFCGKILNLKHLASLLRGVHTLALNSQLEQGHNDITMKWTVIAGRVWITIPGWLWSVWSAKNKPQNESYILCPPPFSCALPWMVQGSTRYQNISESPSQLPLLHCISMINKEHICRQFDAISLFAAKTCFFLTPLLAIIFRAVVGTDVWGSWPTVELWPILVIHSPWCRDSLPAVCVQVS